jgi:hypothetical protein
LPRWTGLITSLRGGAWVITDTDDAQGSRKGAYLVSCDGRDVQDLARQNLGGFRADWSIGAQQTQSAPWLLIDEGNPFIQRPKSCVLEHNGQRETVELDWQRIKRETLLPRLKSAVGAGAAGFGVRKIGGDFTSDGQIAGGYWIALQSLASEKGEEVAKAVEEQKAALREAPFVVLDLRGNGGGSAAVGRQIAVSLFGAAAVDARVGAESAADCAGPGGNWRASEGNIANLQYLLDSAAPHGGPEVRRILAEELRATRDARRHGKSFSAKLDCPITVPEAAPTLQPASLMKGRMILLTDNLCFSSCLLVTRDFRALGAYHVGQTTDAATRYMEVREQYLPSGLSLFSTLQSFDPTSPSHIGPFAPTLIYDGDIADTDALEAWVIGTAFAVSRN